MSIETSIKFSIDSFFLIDFIEGFTFGNLVFYLVETILNRCWQISKDLSKTGLYI